MISIRSMVETDQAKVENLATTTGMFAEGDWQRPDLNNLSSDHQWIVAVNSENEVFGAAFFAPEQVSQSLWNTCFFR